MNRKDTILWACLVFLAVAASQWRDAVVVKRDRCVRTIDFWMVKR